MHNRAELVRLKRFGFLLFQIPAFFLVGCTGEKKPVVSIPAEELTVSLPEPASAPVAQADATQAVAAKVAAEKPTADSAEMKPAEAPAKEANPEVAQRNVASNAGVTEAPTETVAAATETPPVKPNPEVAAAETAAPATADAGSSKDVAGEKDPPSKDGKLDIDDAFAWRTWPDPESLLVITGQQHGYIEPCGCTGLENQKGGMARRHSLIKDLAAKDWNLVPLDSGNQVRRFGPQPSIKFQTAIQGLNAMKYKVVGFGPDDLRLGVENLLSVATDDRQELRFVSSNIVLFDPSLLPKFRIVESGKLKIGISTAIDPAVAGKNISSEITIEDPVAGLKQAADEMKTAGCNYRVLLWYGSETSAKELVKTSPQWDLIVLGNDEGEPTYRPESFPDSQAKIVRVGHKGMYAVLIGLYGEKPEIRYARVPLTHEFKDSPEMMAQLASYQKHLEALGLEGLGLRPIPHPTARKFVGSETCGDCHTTAYAIWQKTPHAHATDSLVHPPNDRSAIPRHFDPECLSCHVTGWNPQAFYPYTTGYLSLTETPKLVGNGCENCHGPGAAHAAAENGDTQADEGQLAALRAGMRLPLEKARDRCMECHDIDNSPDFHKDGAFDTFWKQVEHKGLD
jgi:hypothetical protein